MSASGASTAERGPTHTRASPLRSRSHSSWRSPWLSAECSTATTSPNRARNRASVCGVSADLGDEHDRAAPGLERRLDRTQVHLGLARAGDAVQQQAAAVVGPVALGERGQNLVECALLGAGQRGRRCRLAADVDPGRAPRLGRERELDQAASLQAAQRGRAQRRGHGGPAGSELRQQAALAVVEAHLAGQCLTAGVGQLGDQHPLGRDTVCGPGREHQPQRPRHRRAVLARHPPGECDQVDRQCRGKHRVGLGQPLGRELGAVGHLDDHPERAPAAERDPQQRSHLDVPLIFAKPVVERTADRPRARERLDARDQRGGRWVAGLIAFERSLAGGCRSKRSGRSGGAGVRARLRVLRALRGLRRP